MAKLIDYLPDILTDFYEFRNLLSAEDPEFDRIDDLLYKWRENLFPRTADLEGIERFERLLKIQPIPGDTLESRRFRVIAKLNTRLPYTEIQLRKMLAAICGWEGFTLTVKDLVVLVALTEGSGAKIQIVYEMLREVIPMNLLIEIHQLLRSYMELRVAAATNMGTTLTLFPWQNAALNHDVFLTVAAAFRMGTNLTVFPRMEDALRSAARVAAPGVIRIGTRLITGV